MNLLTNLLRYIAPKYVAKFESAKQNEALKREQHQAALNRLIAWPIVPKYHYKFDIDLVDDSRCVDKLKTGL